MKPVVVLMLKAPRLGQVKTRLAAAIGEGAALEVYRRLAERQLAAVPPGWSVAIHFTPPEAESEMIDWLGSLRPDLRFVAQSEGTLGARLTSAFDAEFRLGSGRVLVIGGDCPGLSGGILNSAASALEVSAIVLGPAIDGGYYLIGLKEPCPELFKGIDWSTAAVLAQTLARIRASNLEWATLPILEDVDDSESLIRAGSTFPPLADLVAVKARAPI